MRFLHILTRNAVLLMLLFPLQLFSQLQLHQLIVASGGVFSNPNDFVSVAAYQPGQQAYQSFGQIRTQAVQYALVEGSSLYVAATDSLVKFNSDTYQREGAIAVSGPRMLLIHGDLLFVSIQYPETSNFVRIYNKHTLQFLKSVPEISGEAAGMHYHNGKIYVAVPGNWMSTVGKLAILDASNGDFIEEVDFGNSGMGIFNFFVYDNQLVTVNKSAWGVSSGIISFFDTQTKQISHINIPHYIGKGIEVYGDLLYLLVNNGIGSFNLITRQIVDTAIVPDPGSANFIYFADVVFDKLAQNFYATISDFFSLGNGLIYALDGQATGTFQAGISAEALALDYRNVSSLAHVGTKRPLLYPNPAGSHPVVNVLADNPIKSIVINGIDGRFYGTVVNQQLSSDMALEVSYLPKGSYLIQVNYTDGSAAVVRFIK